MQILSKEDCCNIKSSLCDFILRVASGKGTPSETVILPEISRITLYYFGEEGVLPNLTS